MAPTIKWQRWDSASYDWLDRTTSGTVYGIEQEVDSWISAVNAHTSNSSRQISRMKGYSDGSGNYNGFTLKISEGSDDLYMGVFSSSTSSRRLYLSETWADDGGNGGYGTWTGGGSDTNWGWTTSGQNFDGLIVYNTTEGQEYLIVTQSMGTGSGYMDPWCIYKTASGRWACFANDGSNGTGGGHVDGVGWRSPSGEVVESNNWYTTATSSLYFYKYSPSPGSASTPSITNLNPYDFTAANRELMNPSSSGPLGYVGDRMVFSDLGNGNEVYALCTGYATGSVSVLVDLR